MVNIRNLCSFEFDWIGMGPVIEQADSHQRYNTENQKKYEFVHSYMPLRILRNVIYRGFLSRGDSRIAGGFWAGSSYHRDSREYFDSTEE